MSYNFKKNIIKNENSCYTLTIYLPKKYNVLNYKIYNHKYILQSGYFENSKIKKKINLNIDKLDTIFILMNFNSNEYFQLVNLKNLYNKTLENIKINLVKNNINLNLASKENFLLYEDSDEEEEQDIDDDEDNDDDEDDDNEDDSEDVENNEDDENNYKDDSNEENENED